MRWSAVLAGTALGIGVWILLQTLGMGLGLAAVETDDAGSLKGAGIGTGIWSILAALIAMFVGGLLAGRLAGTRDPKVGGMHGSVVWALGSVIGLWLIFSVISSLASSAAQVGGAAASATSSVVSGAMSAGGQAEGVAAALGIDASDLVAPINERLKAQGKPPITADQLNATARAVAQRGVREGRLDREVLVEELAKNTNLSRADAEDIAAQFGDRYEEIATSAGAKARELGEDAKHAALVAADRTGKVLLLGGLMMLLSLISAVAGGALGARNAARAIEVDRTRVATGPIPPATTETRSTIITTDEDRL